MVRGQHRRGHRPDPCRPVRGRDQAVEMAQAHAMGATREQLHPRRQGADLRHQRRYAQHALYRYDLATGAETALSIPPGVNYLTGNDPRSPDGRTLMVNHSGADLARQPLSLRSRHRRVAPGHPAGDRQPDPRCAAQVRCGDLQELRRHPGQRDRHHAGQSEARRQAIRRSSCRMAVRPARRRTGTAATPPPSPAAAIS